MPFINVDLLISENSFFVGLILVSEPYFNEAGYENDKGLPENAGKSRNYNENALLLTFEVSEN